MMRGVGRRYALAQGRWACYGSGMSQPASRHLLEHWVACLAAHIPFARMDRWQLEQLASAATERYFPPDAVVLAPSADVPAQLIFLRQGRLLGRRAGRTESDDAFELDAGSLLPVAALLAQRPVTGTYTALEDCFCLFIPWSVARDLMNASVVWADFLNQRMLAFLETSRQRWRHELQAQLQQQF